MALDDWYVNKFAPLDNMTTYPKPGHKLLYSPMTGKIPNKYKSALHIPFHLLWCWCNICTNNISNDMIHFISSCDHIDSSIWTSLALHYCIGPSLPSLAQILSSHMVPHFKVSDFSFTLASGPSSQASSWSSPPWSHEFMSCLICNKLLHHICTYGLISYVSHINTY